MERILGTLFQPFLIRSIAFCPNQFVYSPKRGHRDALALNVLCWLSAIAGGKRIGLYCSDVSGQKTNTTVFTYVEAGQQIGIVKSRPDAASMLM